jgi:diguanylate cyclase (GGDEF)-like protein
MASEHANPDRGEKGDAVSVERAHGHPDALAGQVAESLVAEAEIEARQRVVDEVLAAVQLVLAADGVAFWREEIDHSLVLTGVRSIPQRFVDALDDHVIDPLHSIMLRWPDSPLVAVPIGDPNHAIASEISSLADEEGIVGLAGIPCRIPGDMLGLLVVVHRRAHPWSVRDLGLATGFAGQLGTAVQNSRLFASVRTLASRLSAIHELSLRLAQLQDVDEICRAIVAEAGRVVACDTVRVYRRREIAGEWRPVAAAGSFMGIEDPPLEAIASGPPESLPDWVARRNETLIVSDAAADRRSIFRSSFGSESVLAVPMSFAGTVLGVLVVTARGIDRFGSEDLRALSIFGRYAAQAIANADAMRELARQHQLLERQLDAQRRLLELSEQLVSTLDPGAVVDRVAETIGSVLRYDRLAIHRVEGHRATAKLVMSRARSGAVVDPPQDDTAAETGIVSWVVGRGDAVCANDVAAWQGERHATPDEAAAAVSHSADAPTPARGDRSAGPVMSLVGVPLRSHGVVIGSLTLTRFGADARFDDNEFELAKLFAGQASIAIQNAETHLSVATRADLDALTELRNHGKFEADLAALIAEGRPFSLLMIDLDDFKAFNDTYLHQAGDALLRGVADAIVGATRQNDRAYRYGGDEFAVLLAGASAQHATDVAARIRLAIRNRAAQHTGVPGAHVGASIGASHWPADGREARELITAADEALYDSKRKRARDVAVGPGSGAESAMRVDVTAGEMQQAEA